MYLHKSQLLFWTTLFFLSGIAQLPLYAVLPLASTIAFWYVVYDRILYRYACILVVIAGCAWFLGWVRYNSYLPETHNVPYNTNVSVTGKVTTPPNNNGVEQKLFIVSSMLPGKVYVQIPAWPQYQYGDVLKVNCTLQRPKSTSNFAFDKYLARYDAIASCINPKIALVDTHQGNSIYHALYSFRDNVIQRIRALWPEPASGIISGIMLGWQNDLFTDINETFRTTGTVHILVVSGMHVVIIANVIAASTKRWCSRRLSFIITGLSLAMFALITGLAASVIRAALMGLLPLLAVLLQRTRVQHYGIALVATGIVAYNPYILLYDIGFELSFLATLGIIYFQEAAQRWCRWIPTWFSLRETLSTTAAAMITTTPLIVHIFGTFSVIAPLANSVVVPVSNVILFGGTGVLLLAVISPWVAQYFAFALYTIIVWILSYIQWLSTWPAATIQNITMPPYFLSLSYIIIGLFIACRIRKQSLP